MSGTDHAPSDEHDADQHDDHDDHVEPPPPEPASPAWLPLLGAGLFLGGLLWFLMSSSPEHLDGEAHAEAEAAPAKPAAAAAADPAAARAIRPQIAPGNKLPEPGTAAPARPDTNKLKEALAVGAGKRPAVAAPPPPPPPPQPAPHP